MFRRKHSSSISNNNSGNNINQDSNLLSLSSNSLSQIENTRISLPSEDGSSVSTAATGTFTGASSPLLPNSAIQEGSSNRASNSKRNLLQSTGDNIIPNNNNNNPSETNDTVDDSSDDDEDEDHVVAKAKITIQSGKHLRNVQSELHVFAMLVFYFLCFLIF